MVWAGGLVMGMPELPEGFMWSVTREKYPWLLVALFGPGVTESEYVDVGLASDETAVVALVEHAAERVEAIWCRKRSLDEIVARNWPAP
jgi:hypothetical protein